MTTKKSMRTTWRFLNILLLIIIVCFSYFLKELQLISYTKIISIQIVSTFICIVLEVLQENNKNKTVVIIVRILTIFFSMLLLFASSYVYQMKRNVDTVMESVEEFDDISVAIRKDVNVLMLSDIAKYKIGIQNPKTVDGIEIAKTMIESEIEKTIDSKEYDNIILLLNDAIKKNIDVVIYNDAYLALVSEENPELIASFKVIKNYKVEKIPKTDVTQNHTSVSLDVEGILNADEQKESLLYGNKNDLTFQQEKIQYVEGKDTFAVYISGIDVYGKIGKTSRSDVNIFAIVNPNTRQVLLVTTPRDYFVKIPNVSGEQKDKLTHAGLYGVDTSINTLENIYDFDIDFYVRVNFTSMEQIVDSLGGITVYSEYDFVMGNGYQIKKGYNKLNGENALRFCRQRYNLPGGDNQRGKNQMEAIKAIAKKVTSPTVLLNANKLLKSIQGNIDMNVPYSLIQTIIQNEMDSVSDWKIKTMAAEGYDSKAETFSAPGTELYVMEPNLISLYNIKNEIMKIESGEILEDTISLKETENY